MPPFDEEKFDKILLVIEGGQSLRQALKTFQISSRTFYMWIESDKTLEKQYARAIELRAEAKFDSIQEDYLESPQRDPESGRIDSAWVALQRLKIDAKKWEVSKLFPKKYGDKLELDNKLSGSVNIISLGSGKNPNEAT
jgi:hypothetical protein